MNGSENGYAGALFFSLMSLGALLKLDDVLGWLIGAACALVAAMSFRRGLIRAAQDTEENHQRMEIQFQQLRNKVAETFSSNVNAMNSVNDAMNSIAAAAHRVQKNLQVVGEHASESENLSKLVKSAQDIRLTVAALDENSSALNAELEKISASIDRLVKLTSIANKNKGPLLSEQDLGVLRKIVEKISV